MKHYIVHYTNGENVHVIADLADIRADGTLWLMDNKGTVAVFAAGAWASFIVVEE
jgi:uncharacterized cupin superfamily protein